MAIPDFFASWDVCFRSSADWKGWQAPSSGPPYCGISLILSKPVDAITTTATRAGCAPRGLDRNMPFSRCGSVPATEDDRRPSILQLNTEGLYKKCSHNDSHNDSLLNYNIGWKKHTAGLALTATRFLQACLQESIPSKWSLKVEAWNFKQLNTIAQKKRTYSDCSIHRS